MDASTERAQHTDSVAVYQGEDDTIRRIKEKLRLEDVAGRIVALKPAGKGKLKGLCPFHDEKTPSFHVFADEGRYKCFGCNAKGDVFDFVMEKENIDFPEAKRRLADEAGIDPRQSAAQRKTQDLAGINDLAQAYFVSQLDDTTRSYLNGRGFTDEALAVWGIGRAPDVWDGLFKHMRTQGVTDQTLLELGLVKEKHGRHYDVFRNRVTLPIRDVYGRLLGFTGRTLVTETSPGKTPPAKYLNTPETALFKKGELLFGLDRARDAIRTAKAAIVVEGHLDVVALHQAGFHAAVGAQSATLTEAQIVALERLGVMRLFLAFDNDEAGERGTLAAIRAIGRQMVVQVAQLEGAKDPAELVQRDPTLFRAALDGAITEEEFVYRALSQGVDLADKGQRLELLDKLKAFLRDLNTPGDGHDMRTLVAAKIPGATPAELKTWATDKRALDLEQHAEAEAEAEAEQSIVRERVTGELAPFPVAVYPKFMQDLIFAAADALPAPPDFMGLPMLGVLAAGIGNSRALEVKPGWTERASIYSMIVAEPGSKKSPALALAWDPLQAQQKAMARQAKEAKAAYKEQDAAYQAAVKGGQRDAAPPDPLPMMEQCLTTDATAEAFGSLHAANPRSMTLLQDEASGWVAGMNQYKGGRGNDRQLWLSFWAGADVVINRKGKEAEMIERPHVNVIGGIQPDILTTLETSAGNDGFIDRILFAYPEPVPKEFTREGVSPHLVTQYRTLFFKLVALPPNGDGQPKVLKMTEDALCLYEQWVAAHYAQEREPSFDFRLAGFWAKLEGYLLRIALILHLTAFVAGEEMSETVSADSIAKALQVTDYLKSHAQKVYRSLRATPVDRELQAIYNYLLKQTARRATARDLMTARVPGCHTSDATKTKLKALERAGLGQLTKAKSPAGRTMTYFVLSDTAS